MDEKKTTKRKDLKGRGLPQEGITFWIKAALLFFELEKWLG